MNEAVLNESLNELYEQAPCGYVFTQPDGTIVRVNQTFLSWLGEERESLLSGRRFQDLLTVPGKIFYENQYAPLLRMQGFVKEIAFDFRRRDREPLPALVSSVQHSDADGRPEVIASVIFDATERRSYELELLRARRTAEHLAAVVASSSDAIVWANADGSIESWNTGAEQLFGFTAEKIIGRNLFDLITVNEHEVGWQRHWDAIQAGHPVHLETIGRDTDSSEIDISVALTPHHDVLGNLVGLSAIMRDIRERRTVERMQQEFLAMTTHDLRTPVSGIKGNAQLMQRRGAYSERGVAAIIAQSDRLARLIEDLLLASQIAADRFALHWEMIDLVAEARDAAVFLDASESVIRVEAATESLLVLADRQRIGQVLGNLLTNAMKYSPDDAEIVVCVTQDGDNARVSVTDRGAGIPQQSLANLFDRFYRVPGAAVRASGLGLGLYISRRIVEFHGGRINVESELGVGSTFTVVLPLTQKIA